jgi:hypothetical protein
MKKIAIIAGSLLLASSLLQAEGIDRSGKFGLGVGLGYNGHAMTDVNDGAGAAITMGLGAGFDLRWHATKNFVGGLELEMLYPQRRETTYLGMGYKTLEDFAALTAGANGYYCIPKGAVDLRLGGGIGFLTLSGASIDVTTSSGTTKHPITASGLNVKLGAGMDWYLTPAVSLSFDLGYRIASTGTLKVDDKEAKDSKGETSTADYSGVFSKLGVGVWF